MVTTPTRIVVINTTCLKASMGIKTHYYPTFSIFLYLQNHLHVLTFFDAKYCIILSVILTHSHSLYPVLYAHVYTFFTVLSPVAIFICISVPFISFLVTHFCKTAIFTYRLLY